MKLDRKIDCNTLEVATPAEQKKAKKWRNQHKHISGKIYHGIALHPSKEAALKQFNVWLRSVIAIMENGSNPVTDFVEKQKVPSLEVEYLGPVEVDE